MSQSTNVSSSSSKNKRPYRKGNPLSTSERQQALVARRKDTHKEIRVYVQNALKEEFQRLCEAEGLTQTEMLEVLIKTASSRLAGDVTE
ncbi:replication regulatory protein RepA [Rahnella sp. CG8]|uniref:replication regulatory protein RepA n=1 Tax=Rahnella sp. CG8 TaxID=2726078 RepID=UPI002034258A|nr:replication regulatory protein RepA [Rahnella sp. CG8]MCM2447865.1 replication regulatory protein RepA [Rahnella sp. CG8]